MKLRVKFLLLASLLAFVVVAQGQLGPHVASTLEVVPFPPYHAAGNDVPTTFRLKRGGDPVTLDDLKVSHTEKIHLLIIDESLTDYRHQHPIAMETPGEYRFLLRSRYGGTYLVWAQLVPKSTGAPEFAKGAVAVEGRAKPFEQIMNSTAADEDGYRYELSVEGRRELAVGDPARLKVTVRKPDGMPAENLEPVMGAFATLTAFSGNLQEAILSFPTDSAPASEAARGGPELTFQLTPRSSGCWRLFIQTKISGLTRLASFGLNVSAKSQP